MMKTPDRNRSQLPEKVTKVQRMAEPPASRRSPLCRLSIHRDHTRSRNGNFVIFFLSAQKLNPLTNKLLCYSLYLLMSFLRLQGFVGKPLSRDNFLKSNTLCSGWGTRKIEAVLTFAHLLIPPLLYTFSQPHSPNFYNQYMYWYIYVPSQL